MPEGDTIFRAARTLHRALAGHVVTRFESAYPTLTKVNDDTPVVGRTLERVESRGKHVLMHFSGELVLRTHMRMSGSWHIYRPEEKWKRPVRDARIVVATANFVAVGFTIPIAEFETAHTLERHEALGSLGADLLAAEPADAAEMIRRLRMHGDEEIADVLLNQRVLAGIGNVFKSETLFVARVNPFGHVADLSDETLRKLVDTGRALLNANVRPSSTEGIVTYFGLRQAMRRADPSERLWVYGRGGKPCRRCATPIAWKRQGPYARSTYWCPRCQFT